MCLIVKGSKIKRGCSITRTIRLALYEVLETMLLYENNSISLDDRATIFYLFQKVTIINFCAGFVLEHFLLTTINCIFLYESKKSSILKARKTSSCIKEEENRIYEGIK